MLYLKIKSIYIRINYKTLGEMTKLPQFYFVMLLNCNTRKFCLPLSLFGVNSE